MSLIKKILIGILGLLGFLLVVVVVVPWVVDVDQYRPRIVELASQKMNGQLELGKLKLSLWGQIRIEVGGLKVLDPSGRDVIAVKEAYFHLPFSSIFSGSPSLVFKMEKPMLLVTKNKEGKFNFMNLMKSGVPPAGAGAGVPAQPSKPQGAGGAGSVSLPAIAVNSRLSIELAQALLEYNDEKTGFKTQISDLNVAFRDLSLSRTTAIEIWADLNSHFGPAGKETFVLQGPFRLTGAAQPNLNGGKLEKLAFTARADFDGGEIEVPGIFIKKKGVPAHVELAVAASEHDIVIEKLNARFHNAELKTQGAISNLMALPGAVTPAAPSFHYVIKSNEIEFRPWAELLPPLKEFELGGKAVLEAQLQGPTDKLGYQALFRVEGLTAKAPKLKAQPRMDAEIRIVTDQLEKLLFTLKAPGNDLKVEGKLVSFAQPQAVFEITSTGMDLDQLIEFPPLGAAKAQAESKAVPSSPPVASNRVVADYDLLLAPLRKNPILGALRAKVGVNFKLLKAYQVKMTDIQGSASFHELVASLNDWGMKLWSGNIKASANLDLKPEMPAYRFSTRVAGLELSEAVASQLELFKNTIVGKASFEMDGEGKSFNPKPAIAQLKAKGKFKVEQASFATIDVAKMATEGLNKALDKAAEKVPSLKGKKLGGINSGESKYEFISSDFSLADGKLTAPNFLAKAANRRGLDLKGNTRIGMDDFSLSAVWELSDPYNLTHARDLSVEEAGIKVEHILAEGNQPVRLPVHLDCNLKAPCYSYTEVPEHFAKVALNNLSGAAKGRLKTELKNKIESVIPKTVAPKILEKVPEKTKEQLQDLGKKLFGG